MSQQKLRCKLQERFHRNITFCNLQCNKNAALISCKKSRTILKFSQRCETSCRVPATQFCENELIRACVLLTGDFKLADGVRVVNNFQWARCKLRKNISNVCYPLCNLQCFFSRHRCAASCKKNLTLLQGGGGGVGGALPIMEYTGFSREKFSKSRSVGI